MSLLALALLVLGAADVPVFLPDALARAAAPDRLELVAFEPSPQQGCTARALEPVRITQSGRIALRLRGADARGAPCSLWAWARIRLYSKVPVLSRDVASGGALAGAIAWEEREQRSPSASVELPSDALAARALRRGQLLRAADLRSAAQPAPGAAVTVMTVVGAVTLEQPGRVISCRGAVCARTASGALVRGTFREGRLWVEDPA